MMTAGPVRSVLVGFLMAGILALPSCRDAGHKQTASRGEGKVVDRFADWGVDLGVPDDAVFFLAEVAAGPEPLANKRWAVGPDGALRLGENGEPFDSSLLPRSPFNRPLRERPIATLPAAEVRAFLDWLDAQGFFQMPADLGPPDGVKVSDGMDLWVVARRSGRSAQVRLRPGAEFAAALQARFDGLVDPHLR